MAFPAKTDRARILSAALQQLAQEGLSGLSLRSLAASLELAPNALYRYFPSRAALQGAMTAEITAQVHARLHKAAGRKAPEPAIRSLARAYVAFAREQTHFYTVFLASDAESGDEQEAAHTALWKFVVEQVARVAGSRKAPEAAVALWAFLHGFVDLSRAICLDDAKPLAGFEWGLEAWLRAARSPAAGS